MSRLQALLLRQSERRTELGGLLDLEERSEEQEQRREAIVVELRGMERDIRDARMAEPEIEAQEIETETGTEARELLQLRSKFQVSRLLGAVAGKNALDGETAEYMQEVGADGRLPVEVFEPARERRSAAIETRAVTPGVQGGQQQRPIVPAVFKQSVAAFLGIMMPSAGMGDQVFPVLSTVPGSGAGPAAKGAAVDSSAGAFTVSSQQPRRIGASFTVRVEDLARLAGMESALRSAIQQVVGEKLDDEVLNGDAAAYNTDGEIRGLLAQLTDPSNPSSGAESWTRFNTAFTSHLKDPWATQEGSVRALLGEATYKLAAGVFRANESTESFSAYWNRVGGGVRMSGKIAAPSSNIQQAVIVRANPAGDSAALMPHWAGFDMTIRDMYTEAAKGQVTVTIHMLVGDVVLLRGDVYVQDSFRVA